MLFMEQKLIVNDLDETWWFEIYGGAVD